jgi:hypothetical protein
MKPDDGCRTIPTEVCSKGFSATEHLQNFFDSDPRVTLTLVNRYQQFLTLLLNELAWTSVTTWDMQ